ncbi:hypothetical protein [Actinomadura nitritigenes]
MIDDANAIEDDMARWFEAVVGYAEAIAVVLAGELRGRLLTQPAPA